MIIIYNQYKTLFSKIPYAHMKRGHAIGWTYFHFPSQILSVKLPIKNGKYIDWKKCPLTAYYFQNKSSNTNEKPLSFAVTIKNIK